MTKKFVPVLIFIITFLLFLPTFNLFFVQDDFFLLNISKANSLADFLRFFIPANGVIWYRPLSSQIFFFICRCLFGLNPLPYHILMFVTHLFNIYLLFLFIKEVSKNEKQALITSFVYGISSVHFITLAWLATYSFILGPTFVLLTLIYFLKRKYVASLIFFILGLLTSEVVIWTVIPLLVITVTYQKSRIKLIPFLLAILVLILVRNVLFPVAYVEAYRLVTDPQSILVLLRFYFFRTVGVPMLIKNIPNDFNKFIILSLSAIIILIPIIILIYKKSNTKQLFLSIIIYLSFLSIFLLLPNHYSPHYLTFAFIGSALFIGSVINSGSKLIRVIFIFSFFTLQLVTVRTTYDSHWIIKRASLAKKLVEEENLIHPVSSEEYISLGAGKAYEVFKK